jgi:hypothetical protein
VYPSTSSARCARMTDEMIIAVGLLTKRDVKLLGPTFSRLWPVEEAPAFSDLLKAIDDEDLKVDQDQSAGRSRR